MGYPTLQELIAEYNRKLNDEHKIRLEELRQAFAGFSQGQQGIGGQRIGGQVPPWQNLAQMNAALAAQRAREAANKPKPVDKPTRIKEIEAELDIIRGRVPTPKGYTINKSKVRSLLIELKELQA